MIGFTYETVLSTIDDKGVRTITLNRPDSLNAMNLQLIKDVAAAFNDANADHATRAMIFTGSGRAFCAGDDRRAHVHPENETEARAIVDAIQRATQAIVFGAKPVVGAINGWAVGVALNGPSIATSHLGKERQRLLSGGFPNLFVTGAVTSLLPAVAGLNKAREMLFFGERYTADELKEIGVAWRIVENMN